MSTRTDFKRKITDLQSQISEKGEQVSSKDNCVPTVLIVGVIAPLLIWMILYFVQPSFVQKKEGQKYVRCGTKVFYWTVIVTVVIWVALYLFTYCQGYKSASMFCSK